MRALIWLVMKDSKFLDFPSKSFAQDSPISSFANVRPRDQGQNAIFRPGIVLTRVDDSYSERGNDVSASSCQCAGVVFNSFREEIRKIFFHRGREIRAFRFGRYDPCRQVAAPTPMKLRRTYS